MTTAIILAAGRGRRMQELTKHTTKPMLKVCDRTLLEYAIDIAKGIGATRIIVLARYFIEHYEKVLENIGDDIELVALPEPDYQTLSDLNKALDHITEGNVFVCNADYIKLPHTIKSMKTNQKSISVYTSFDLDNAADDEMKVKTDGNGNFLDASKQLTDFDGVYTGDFFCPEKYLGLFKQAVKLGLLHNEASKAVTEHSFIELQKLGAPVKAVDIGAHDWFELDTPEELQKAEEYFGKAALREEVSCNLCGKNVEKQIFVNTNFRVVICTNCSLVYLNPRMTQELYDHYYEGEYQSDRHNITSRAEAIHHLEKKDSYRKKLERFQLMKPYITKESKVFEIGAGMGTQLKVIKDTVGCDVSGIEVSLLGVEVANHHYKIPVQKVTLERLAKNNDKKYDFIILHHVLEHFLNPLESLRLVHSLTNMVGRLYIAVPNMLHPDEPLDRFFRLPHTYYFSLDTLRPLLQASGWQIEIAKVDTQEIRIIATKSVPQSIDYLFLPSVTEVRLIMRVVRHNIKKYYILRFLKVILYNVLPRRIFLMVKRVTITFLRKLGIITI